MSEGITEIASYLATRIPTGSEAPEERVQDWRRLLYNAKETRMVEPLTDFVRKQIPEDLKAEILCGRLRTGIKKRAR